MVAQEDSAFPRARACAREDGRRTPTEALRIPGRARACAREDGPPIDIDWAEAMAATPHDEYADEERMALQEEGI